MRLYTFFVLKADLIKSVIVAFVFQICWFESVSVIHSAMSISGFVFKLNLVSSPHLNHYRLERKVFKMDCCPFRKDGNEKSYPKPMIDG